MSGLSCDLVTLLAARISLIRAVGSLGSIFCQIWRSGHACHLRSGRQHSISKMVTSAGQTRLNPGLLSLASPHVLPKYRSARLGASIAGLGSPRKLRSLVSSPHYFTRLPLLFAPESQRQAPIRPMSGWSVARLSCRRYQIFLKKMPPLPNAFPHHVEPFP